MAERLKVHVDPDKCQGHARCKALAPELFELDEYGNAHEAGDGTVPSPASWALPYSSSSNSSGASALQRAWPWHLSGLT